MGGVSCLATPNMLYPPGGDLIMRHQKGPRLHPMTQAVSAAARRLEIEQFRHPDDRHRLNDIRALALQQVADDVPTLSGPQRGRVGREWVGHDYGEESTPLYGGRWTVQQQALEQAMIPFLDRLTVKQREVVHLMFWGRLTERQTALVLNISRVAVRERRDSAMTALRKGLTGAFLENDK